MGMEQPLRSGQQSHPFLVFTISKDVEMVPNLPEAKMKEYNMKVGERQAVYVIISRLFKDLSGKTIVAPASDLKTKNNTHCLRCTYKAQHGHLFPLKKSMIFITKPVLWIRYDEIETVEFVKGMSRARSFDLRVYISGKTAVEFLQMERGDGEELMRFLRSVNVSIANEDVFKDRRQSLVNSEGPSSSRAAVAKPAAEGDDDEEDDEDFDDDDDDSSEGDDDFDDAESDEPKKKKVKRK